MSSKKSVRLKKKLRNQIESPARKSDNTENFSIDPARTSDNTKNFSTDHVSFVQPSTSGFSVHKKRHGRESQKLMDTSLAEDSEYWSAEEDLKTIAEDNSLKRAVKKKKVKLRIAQEEAYTCLLKKKKQQNARIADLIRRIIRKATEDPWEEEVEIGTSHTINESLESSVFRKGHYHKCDSDLEDADCQADDHDAAASGICANKDRKRGTNTVLLDARISEDGSSKDNKQIFEADITLKGGVRKKKMVKSRAGYEDAEITLNKEQKKRKTGEMVGETFSEDDRKPTKELVDETMRPTTSQNICDSLDDCSVCEKEVLYVKNHRQSSHLVSASQECMSNEYAQFTCKIYLKSDEDLSSHLKWVHTLDKEDIEIHMALVESKRHSLKEEFLKSIDIKDFIIDEKLETEKGVNEDMVIKAVRRLLKQIKADKLEVAAFYYDSSMPKAFRSIKEAFKDLHVNSRKTYASIVFSFIEWLASTQNLPRPNTYRSFKNAYLKTLEDKPQVCVVTRLRSERKLRNVAKKF